MFRSTSGSVLFALALGISATGLALPAQAASTATIDDTGANAYWGGATNSSVNGDVLQDPGVTSFETSGATVSRVLNTNTGRADVTVTIQTNFARDYVPGSGGPDGTVFGSLFFGPKLNQGAACGNGICTGSNSTNDTFIGNPSRFNRVLTMPASPIATTGSASLYSLSGTGSDVQLSFFPDASQTISPVPTGELAGAIFRSGQAIGLLPGGGTLITTADGGATAINGTWTIDSLLGTLTFVIRNENNLLGTEFVVAWAMSCGNDTLLGNVSIDFVPPGVPPGVPVPGAFVLMGTVLFGAGGISRWRKVRARKAA
jgi:hypothetical protein